MTFTLTTTAGRKLTVTGELIGHCRGRREWTGLGIEPDEPGFFEVEQVTDEDDKDVELSDAEAAEIERMAFQIARNRDGEARAMATDF